MFVNSFDATYKIDESILSGDVLPVPLLLIDSPRVVVQEPSVLFSSPAIPLLSLVFATLNKLPRGGWPRNISRATGAPRSQVVGQEVGVPSAGQTGVLRGRFRGEKRSIWEFSDIVFRGGQGVGDLGPHPSWIYGPLRLTSSREFHSTFVRAFLLLC